VSGVDAVEQVEARPAHPGEHAHRHRPLVDLAAQLLPQVGEADAVPAQHRLVGDGHGLHPRHPEQARIAPGIGDQVPDTGLAHQPVRVDGAVGGLPLAA
jgi:hypothetical protein